MRSYGKAATLQHPSVLINDPHCRIDEMDMCATKHWTLQAAAVSIHDAACYCRMCVSEEPHEHP